VDMDSREEEEVGERGVFHISVTAC
jgi:hypothetical protein